MGLASDVLIWIISLSNISRGNDGASAHRIGRMNLFYDQVAAKFLDKYPCALSLFCLVPNVFLATYIDFTLRLQDAHQEEGHLSLA